MEPDILFSDGDIFNFNGRRLRIVATPGHSICSCYIVDEEHEIYMAGDSAQGRGEARPLIFHSVAAYTNSLRKLLGEPIEVLVNSHPFPPYGKAVLRGRKYASTSRRA
ncbi:unnamed protein product [marine sediment metagenome]|uniref:Metallo-beta-lactamase domain-containing protein n=1 Tax=marine sediment metagenome TaxID=412755 RepID=X0TDJ1_9ZZZZ